MRVCPPALFAVCFVACSESLPPLKDPGSIFTASVSARYVLNIQDNSVVISVSIKSNYDETLQEKADILGSVNVIYRRDPEFARTMLIGVADLRTSGKYNPATGVLTVNPGDVLRFDVVWDFRDDDGVYVPDSLFQYYEDPECPFRCVAEEEVFAIRGGIKLYDRVARVDGEMVDFSICHIRAFVDGCPPVVTAIPCSKRPPTIDPKLCY